ncbi:F-actin-uncapping protein LRRC16A [Armadillidium vulgare]|nr:F-actin-uncapping protein LRRC16A [Armadillidium vulgare]
MRRVLLCLTVCDRTYSFYTNNEDPSSSHEVDTMILSLGTALKNIFPSIPIKHIIRKVDVQPPKRIQPLEDLERVTLGGTRDMGPCGGFSDQYACMCDYHALPYRAEVAWDVDTIYLSHDTRELYLHDFDYLEQNIEELYLDNIGAKAEFANKLSLALLSNSNIPLQKLDISHNPIEDKGAVHISNPIGRQAKGLSHLNLASCGLTSKGVNMLAHSLSVNKVFGALLRGNVLLGLACNENITEVSLDLSNNHLGATGAQILESCIHGVRCLVSLDISENSLENQLGPVVLAISKNKSIKSLNIGKNLNSIKSKHVNQVMEAVVHMLQEEECVLETLIFNDSRLKLDLHSLLNALGSNRCLQRLDISNYVMKFMPFPVHDVTLCMKTAPERTENIMRKIQDSLCRNISPRKYSNGQAFRLQQGFLLSSTQQQVDRLVLQTGEIARTLKRTVSSSPDKDTSSNVNSLLQWSDALISDAENSKQYYTISKNIDFICYEIKFFVNLNCTKKINNK